MNSNGFLFFRSETFFWSKLLSSNIIMLSSTKFLLGEMGCSIFSTTTIWVTADFFFMLKTRLVSCFIVFVVGNITPFHFILSFQRGVVGNATWQECQGRLNRIRKKTWWRLQSHTPNFYSFRTSTGRKLLENRASHPPRCHPLWKSPFQNSSPKPRTKKGCNNSPFEMTVKRMTNLLIPPADHRKSCAMWRTGPPNGTGLGAFTLRISMPNSAPMSSTLSPNLK